MMDFNGGFAYVAPSVITPELTKEVYGDPMQQYRKQQQQLAQQKQADLQQQRKLENQAKLNKHLDDETKDLSTYATGDPTTDTNINGDLKNLHADVVKQIYDNPNMSEMEIDSYLIPKLKDISDRAIAVKAARAQMDKQTEQWGKTKGIRTDGLLQGAVNRMLYDTDENGKPVLKKKIDPNHDYVGDELHENSSKYINGDEAITEVFKDEKLAGTATDITDREGTDKAGVKIKSGVKGEIYPWQHTITDPKTGKITDIVTNSQNAVDPDTGKPIVDPVTKQPMQIVDDQTFAKFNKPAIMLQMKGDVDAMLTKAGIDPKSVDPTSEKYQMFLKHALLLKIDKNSPKKIATDYEQSNTAARDKQEMGIGTVLGAVETRAEKKHDDQLSGSNYGRIIDAMNGDDKIINSGTAKVITTSDGKNHNLVDITDTVGGFATNADKQKSATENEFNKIPALYVERNNPGKLYILEHANSDDIGGHLKILTPKEVENMMRRHGPQNGFAKNSNDIDRLLKLKPINPEAPKAEPSVADQRAAEVQALRDQNKAANSPKPLGQ